MAEVCAALSPLPRRKMLGPFSWTDFSLILEEPEGPEWERAQRIAEAVYYGKRLPRLNGAIFYHATYVRPDWSKERQRVARIGRHVFYR